MFCEKTKTQSNQQARDEAIETATRMDIMSKRGFHISEHLFTKVE